MLGFALLTLAGCDGSDSVAPTPTAPTAPAPSSPTPIAPTPTTTPEGAQAPENTPPAAPEARAMVTGPCVAGEAVALGQSEARRVSARLAFGHDGGLVAFTQDDAHVGVRRLDASGQLQPEATQVELTNAMDLFGVYHLASHYLVLSHGLCPGGRRMNKCLALRALNADGSAAGEEHLETTREWMTSPQLRVDGDSLVVLRGHLYIPSVLERYRVAADGSVSREALADLGGNAAGEEQSAPLGLAVEPGRWAALVRDYDSQHERYVMRLYRSSGSPTVLPLGIGEEERVLDLSFVDDGLRLLMGARTGPAHPKLIVLGPELQVTTPARRLSAEELLAGNRVVPSVASDHRRLTFSRHDLAERPIGEPLPLTSGDQADVDGDGAVFAVASVLTSRRQPSTISLQTIRCQQH